MVICLFQDFVGEYSMLWHLLFIIEVRIITIKIDEICFVLFDIVFIIQMFEIRSEIVTIISDGFIRFL